MADATIIKTAFFAASPETVWSFLTDKDKLGEWFYRAEADLAAGEDYVLLGQKEDGSPTKMCWGTVLTMQQPSKLEYSFTIAPLNGVMTTVNWALEEVPGGTKLTLTHQGLGEAGDSALGLIMALDSGWEKHLAAMRAGVKASA